MTVKQVKGEQQSDGVSAVTAVENSHGHLHVSGDAGQRSLDPNAAGTQHGRSRRFVATRAINDDDRVALLAPVRRSLRREQTYRRALASADGLAAVVVTVLTSAVSGGGHVNGFFLLAAAVAVLVGQVEGLYDRDDMVVRKSTVREWRTVLHGAALTTIGTYMIWRLSSDPTEAHGMRVFAFMLATLFCLQMPARAAARRIARTASTDERCLIIGPIARCRPLGQQLKDVSGVDLIGSVSDEDIDCSVAGVHELVEQLAVERVIVVPHSEWGDRGALRLVQSCKWLGVRVSLMPTVMTVVGASTTMDELDSMVLLGVPRFGLSQSSDALKRAFDLVGASVVLTITAPLLLLVALAVKIDSRGPAFFRQRRIGRDGRPFTMFKFRSMVDGAERMKAELDLQNDTQGLFKMADDPRVTRLGKFIRRAYVDELPQLINVLRGDMSLVGPRPLIESEDALLRGYDRHRSKLMPGMTGPWQLRGPLDASLPELAKLDYMYASSWTIWADIDILAGTAARVLTRRGH